MWLGLGLGLDVERPENELFLGKCDERGFSVSVWTIDEALMSRAVGRTCWRAV